MVTKPNTGRKIRDWRSDIVDLNHIIEILGNLYDQLHDDLCPRAQFCSAHRPAGGIIESLLDEKGFTDGTKRGLD